jgi:hypothetical protein
MRLASPSEQDERKSCPRKKCKIECVLQTLMFRHPRSGRNRTEACSNPKIGTYSASSRMGAGRTDRLPPPNCYFAGT